MISCENGEGNCKFPDGACRANGYCYELNKKMATEHTQKYTDPKYDPAMQDAAREGLISWSRKIEKEKAEFMMRFGFRPRVLILGRLDYDCLKETVRVYQGIMPTRTTEGVGEQYSGMEIAKVELDSFVGFGVEWEDLKK